MSFDIEAIEADDYLDVACWMQSVGLWDGRKVTLEEAPEFQKMLEQRLQELLYSLNPNSVEFDQFGSLLASLGTEPENYSLLARDIQELRVSADGKVVLAGFKKSASKFWKKHKTAILIGVGVFVFIGAVVVVNVCTAGTAAGVTTAALAALSESNSSSSEQTILSNRVTSVPTTRQILPQSESLLALFDSSQFDYSQYGQSPLLPPSLGSLPFPEPSAFPSFYQEYMQSSQRKVAEKSFPSLPALEQPSLKYGNLCEPIFPLDIQKTNFFESIGHRVIDPPAFTFTTHPLTAVNAASATLSTPPISSCRIGGINGMATSFEQAMDHSNYFQQFATDQKIEWVYNRTHGIARDVFTIFTDNYNGCSGVNAEMLQKNWTKFHQDNKDNPDVKYLQISHSQGAIHVRNALEGASKEIRNRVFSLSFAPGIIIPRELCYEAFNYASKYDPVPNGVLIQLMYKDHKELDKYPKIDKEVKLLKQLIRLDPHPTAKGMDHSLQSLTFVDVLKKHITEYLKCGGVYK